MASPLFKEVNKPKALDDQAEWVMEFVDRAEEQRSGFEDMWTEVENNFLVRPHRSQSLSSNTKYPLASAVSDFQSRSARDGRSELKDPETHQVVMSIVSNIILSIAPEGQFVKAGRQGAEDLYRGRTTSQLLEYDFRKEGAYWAMFEWLLSAGYLGTGILEAFWHYEEQPQEFRTIEVDPLFGEELSTEQVLMAPSYDDVKLEAFDLRSFYPDTGAAQMHQMKGAARRFTITAHEAKRRAKAGIYTMAAVDRAIERRSEQEAKRENYYSAGDDTGLNPPLRSHPDFLDMPGFRYCGQTPFKGEDGWERNEIVVLNGETVRSKVWPRRLPWFDCKVTPRFGSFYGISPAELCRFDQDFADILKMMLADAVVKMTHPPHIYDRNAGVDVRRLRRFAPEIPIAADRVDAIQQVIYNPPLGPAFSMYQGIKQQIRESTSATDVNQGLGIGTKRLSASEAVATTQRSGIRPEMFNRVMEHVWLPPLGKYMLKLNQQFLETSEDLADRIGQSEAVISLADIMADFDITFVGSKLERSSAEMLQAFREIVAAAGNPQIGQVVPWIPVIRGFFDRLGAYEIAAMVGNEEVVRLNVLMNTIAAPNPAGGNNNGTVQTAPATNMLPAQALGGIQP